MDFSSFLAKGCSTAWCNHRWQRRSFPEWWGPDKFTGFCYQTHSTQTEARPHSERMEGNKNPSCILHIVQTSDKGFSPPTKHILQRTHTDLGTSAAP